MGSKSKIEQARRIARQYSADMDEVYKMMTERGMSGTAIIKKLERRQRQQVPDVERIVILLRFYVYGNMFLDDETVARQILRKHNANCHDEVTDFVMAELKKYKRKALVHKIAIVTWWALLLLVVAVIACLGFFRGDYGGFVISVIAVVFDAVSLVVAFNRSLLKCFEGVVWHQLWWRETEWHWKSDTTRRIRCRGTKLVLE